jgi:hypothetical protein
MVYIYQYFILQHENWAVETRKLENFICTKSKPQLFFMPRILTPDTENKLKDSKKAVDGILLMLFTFSLFDFKRMSSHYDHWVIVMAVQKLSCSPLLKHNLKVSI